MSSENAKRALEACEKGVELMIATAKSNQEITNDYNNRLIPEYNAKWDEWKKRKEQRRRDIDDWENKVNQRAESKRDDSKQWNNCVATWECDAGKHHDWCRNDFGDGWYHAGKNQNCGACTIFGCSQCHGICKKDDGLRRREAISEIGNRPADFNETEPQRPTTPEQNDTNINIACCANITQILASQINDSAITQANDCMSNLRQGYDDAVRKEEEERKRKEDEERKRKEEEKREEERKSLMKKAGVGGFIIICSCLFLFIIISLIFGLSGSSEDTDMEYSQSTYSVPTYASTSVPTSMTMPISAPPPPYSESESSGFLGGLF